MNDYKQCIRYCAYCNEPGTSVKSAVPVVPYYSYKTKILKNPVLNCDVNLPIIEEVFVCPSCGNTVTNEYNVKMSQEDMCRIVDRIVNNER